MCVLLAIGRLSGGVKQLAEEQGEYERAEARPFPSRPSAADKCHMLTYGDHSWIQHSQSAQPTTETELGAIAAAEAIGLSRQPNGVEHASRERHAGAVAGERGEQILTDVAHPHAA